MEGKKLIINCGTCDATEATEEKLSGYDQVKINCGCVFVTPASQQVLMAHGVSFNTGNTAIVPDGTSTLLTMGDFTITAADAPQTPTALVVMGNLAVESGAGETAASYVSISVMGNLICPKSINLWNARVMGSQIIYPDGYEYVNGDVKLDRLSHIRWAGKKVYTDGDVIVDKYVDFAALRDVGTFFACTRLIAPESLLTDAMTVVELSNDAEIVALPDGATYVSKSQKLTKALLRRSKRLWIDGGLTVERGEAGLLDELEYLHVTGKAVIPEELEEEFIKLDPECENIFTYRGKLIRREDEVELDKALLARETFVTVLDCDEVKLDKSLTAGEIETQLAIVNCDQVFCTPEQRGAVRSICEGVNEISSDDPPVTPKPEDPNTVTNTVRINCGTYKF